MDPITFARLWMVVKPVKRLKQWRQKRKMESWRAEHGEPADEVAEDFNLPTGEVSMGKAVAAQLVLAVLRHSMTALAPLGVTVSDDWMVQTTAIVVGLIGLLWSFIRKAK
jgi:hypothetical protein